MPRSIDKFYIAYFVLHVFITLLIDAAIAIPEQWQLPIQKSLLAFHVSQNSDILIITSPAWLKAFVWVELLLQTPFFVWAAVDLSRNKKRVWAAILVYGVEASTTTFACLAEVFVANIPQAQKLNLLAIYFPTFLLPLIMAIDFGRRITAQLTGKAKVE